MISTSNRSVPPAGIGVPDDDVISPHSPAIASPATRRTNHIASISNFQNAHKFLLGIVGMTIPNRMENGTAERELQRRRGEGSERRGKDAPSVSKVNLCEFFPNPFGNIIAHYAVRSGG